jgi:hypothetical protein
MIQHKYLSISTPQSTISNFRMAMYHECALEGRVQWRHPQPNISPGPSLHNHSYKCELLAFAARQQETRPYVISQGCCTTNILAIFITICLVERHILIHIGEPNGPSNFLISTNSPFRVNDLRTRAFLSLVLLFQGNPAALHNSVSLI